MIEPSQVAGIGPTKWIEQLSKVWAVIQKAKAAGVQLHVTPPEPTAPAEGS